MASKDKTGQRFGRLVVREPSPEPSRNRKWVCDCDCGNVVSVTGCNLATGNSKSCGCLRAELGGTYHLVHGDCGSHEYMIWSTMKARCYRQTAVGYKNYGGRGVSVCDRWRHSYQNFLDDMGRKPEGDYSIERRDNDGNYDPQNCYWATRKQQSRNRRGNVRVTFQGKTQTVADWAVEVGMSPYTLYHRIRKGWPPEIALRPLDHRRKGLREQTPR